MQQKFKIVSTSYSKTESFNDPQKWLQRIDFYTGILKELAKRHVVTSIERINYTGELNEEAVDYHFIDLKRRIARFPGQMHSYIKNLQPDVVLVNGLVFPLQVIQLRFSLGRDVRIFLLHRSEKPFTGVKRRLQRLADKYIDAYLFTSAAFADQWKKNISVEKIHEVVQASSVFQRRDKQKARSILQLSEGPVFLWVGNLIARKDPITVLKAFLQFQIHQPAARLYMIYQTGELLKEIKELIGKSEAVCLIGKIEHGELENWYSTADFIIAGSHHEGSGVAVIEAMSCGCIPILTNIPSFKKMTGSGKCGLLYEPANDSQLLSVLLKTKQMDIAKEGNKSLQQFEKELSFNAIAGKIEKLIEQLNEQ